jgi:hypothetical protein
MRTIFYKLITEDAVKWIDLAEDLARTLRRSHGYTPEQIRNIYKQSQIASKRPEDKAKDYFKLLDAELQKLKEKEEISDDFIPTSDEEIPTGKMAPEKEKKVSDEAIIGVLEYLVKVFEGAQLPSTTGYKRGDDSFIKQKMTDDERIKTINASPKDKVRVLAARLKIDPDIYLTAGFGSLPENYTDEDVWKTMDASKKGKVPFYDSVWQPLYMDSLERLQNLSEEERAEIKGILDQHSEKVEKVTYPINSKEVGSVYEARLVDDIMIISESGPMVISKGSKIKFSK